MGADIGNIGLGNATAETGGAATGVGDVEGLLQQQFEQGLRLSQIQAQSGIIKNLTTALQGVANNVAP